MLKDWNSENVISRNWPIMQKKADNVLSTPFDKESAELIYKLDLPAFKIGSER
jgi:sialic acid synthase SpsE